MPLKVAAVCRYTGSKRGSPIQASDYSLPNHDLMWYYYPTPASTGPPIPTPLRPRVSSSHITSSRPAQKSPGQDHSGERQHEAARAREVAAASQAHGCFSTMHTLGMGALPLTSFSRLGPSLQEAHLPGAMGGRKGWTPHSSSGWACTPTWWAATRQSTGHPIMLLGSPTFSDSQGRMHLPRDLGATAGQSCKFRSSEDTSLRANPCHQTLGMGAG